MARIVKPAEETQCVVFERLQPKRYAIDACCGEIGEAGGFYRGGIAFERDLDSGCETPELLGLSEQVGHQGWGHQ